MKNLNFSSHVIDVIGSFAAGTLLAYVFHTGALVQVAFMLAIITNIKANSKATR